MDYKELYERNADFKRYADRYCRKHDCSVEEALQHVLVQEVGQVYKEKADAEDTVAG